MITFEFLIKVWTGLNSQFEVDANSVTSDCAKSFNVSIDNEQFLE